MSRYIKKTVCLGLLAMLSVNFTPLPGNGDDETQAYFQLIKTIALEAADDCLISVVVDIALDGAGNILIADPYMNRAVYIFDSAGRFIRQLGGNGEGPGEYHQPTSVAVCPDGTILVTDYIKYRIHLYDPNFEYLCSKVMGNTRIRYVHVHNSNEIYFYKGGAVDDHRIFDTITRVDKDFNVVCRFAPIPEIANELNCWAANDGMDLDQNGFIYEMNPLVYQVRKYAPDGKLIRSYTADNKNYKIDVKSKKMPIILNGPYCLDSGVVLVQFKDGVDIISQDLVCLKQNIPFEEKIVHSTGELFVTAVWPSEMDGGNEDDASNPILKFYSIREGVLPSAGRQ